MASQISSRMKKMVKVLAGEIRFHSSAYVCSHMN